MITLHRLPGEILYYFMNKRTINVLSIILSLILRIFCKFAQYHPTKWAVHNSFFINITREVPALKTKFELASLNTSIDPTLFGGVNFRNFDRASLALAHFFEITNLTQYSAFAERRRRNSGFYFFANFLSIFDRTIRHEN